MIVSGGENVFPAEIEELLAGHEAIDEAAVIGVDDEKFGQRLKAFVVVRDGAQLSEDDIKDYVKQNLARYKIPREVVFVDELPRNPTGKVLKRELAERDGEQPDSSEQCGAPDHGAGVCTSASYTRSVLILPPGHAQALRTRRQFRAREKWLIGAVLGTVAALVLAVVISLAIARRKLRQRLHRRDGAVAIGAQSSLRLRRGRARDVQEIGAPAATAARRVGTGRRPVGRGCRKLSGTP